MVPSQVWNWLCLSIWDIHRWVIHASKMPIHTSFVTLKCRIVRWWRLRTSPVDGTPLISGCLQTHERPMASKKAERSSMLTRAYSFMRNTTCWFAHTLDHEPVSEMNNSLVELFLHRSESSAAFKQAHHAGSWIVVMLEWVFNGILHCAGHLLCMASKSLKSHSQQNESS